MPSFASPLVLRPEFVSKTRRAALFLVLLLFPMGGFMTWFGVHTALELREQSAVWSRGTETNQAEIDGHVRTKAFIFSSLDGTLRYRDANGEVHSSKVDAVSAFESFPTEKELTVRYDPEHPERVAISYVQELSYGAWVWVVFAVGMGGFFLVGGVLAVLGSLRTLKAARLCEREGELLIISVDSSAPQVVKGRPTGQHEVSFRFPGETKVRKAVLQREPLTSDPAAGPLKGLALRSRWLPESPVVIGEGLYPYELSDENLRHARSLLASAAGGVAARSA